jgi:hypothetical protein
MRMRPGMGDASGLKQDSGGRDHYHRPIVADAFPKARRQCAPLLEPVDAQFQGVASGTDLRVIGQLMTSAGGPT